MDDIPSSTIPDTHLATNLPTPTPSDLISTNPTLSKNAQKKILKEEKRALQKLERKAREKDAKAAKKRAREENPDGFVDEEAKPKKAKVVKGKIEPFDARIVVDLGFDEMMTEKECGSLCSQLGFTYASNRRAQKPFTSLLCTSLNGRTKKYLDGVGGGQYTRWKGVTFWEEGYERLWIDAPVGSSLVDGVAGPARENGFDKSELVVSEPPAMSAAAIAGGSTEVAKPNLAPEVDNPTESLKRAYPVSSPTSTLQSPPPPSVDKSTVVYLSADSEHEITELKPGETYIIGGIVDRNRYKNLCQKKAQTQTIRTARLPIGTYLADLPTRKVLTVNQVFDILLRWVDERDWKKAFESVVPKRKFREKKKGGKGKGVGEGNDGEENEDGGQGEEVMHVDDLEDEGAQ